MAPWVGRQAKTWGRRPLLLIGFGALPVRALLFASVLDPPLLIVFLTASRAPRLACEGAKDAVVTVIFAECPPRVARENGVSIAVRGCAVRRRSAGESGSVLDQRSGLTP